MLFVQREIPRPFSSLVAPGLSCHTGVFFQPVPDTQSLPEAVWNRRSELVRRVYRTAFEATKP